MENDFLERVRRDFQYISKIFETGDSLSIKNNDVGFISVDKGNIGKSGNGLQHIIEQRFEKDSKSIDEITALLGLVVNATEYGNVVRNVEIYQNEKDIGTFDIEKNGIISFVSKTRDGKDEKFVITGFDDFSKKEEAGAAIATVIANNSYAPEFVIVKEQVVATLASSYILHLDELKRNHEKGDLKKVNQEIKRIEHYKNCEELKQFIASHNEVTHSSEKSTAELLSENERLRKENLALGKQIIEMQKSLMKKEIERSEKSASRRRSTDDGFSRGL